MAGERNGRAKPASRPTTHRGPEKVHRSVLSFHSLRHTHASVLIHRGNDILLISRRLGHGKASVTLDTYGHLIEGADEAAAKGVLK